MMRLRTILTCMIGILATSGCGATDPASSLTGSTEPNARPLSAQLSGGRDRLVWNALKPTNWDVYYFSGPQAEPKRLTDDPGPDYDAVISPDGRWVVFTSERRGNPDLYALDLQAGGQPRLLVDSPAMEDQAAISPDGSTIAFMSDRDGNADIYTLPFDPAATQSMEKAANATKHAGGDFRPAFSPDGKQIAFSSDRDTAPAGHPIFAFTRHREGDIYVMERGGNNVRRLTNAANWDGSPVWSPDGKTIFFYSGRDHAIGPPTSPILGQEGGFEIWAMDADGARQRRITPKGVEALSPSVTADGRIVFATRSSYKDWSLASVKLDGSDMRRETDGKNNYWNPSASGKAGALVCHGVGPTDVQTQAVEAILGPGPLLSPNFPVELAAPEIPGGALALYPMRHTTGLAPHPGRNEVIVTIEDEKGTRLVRANFDGAAQSDLFSVAGIGIVAGVDGRSRLFDIKYSNDGNLVTFTQGVFAGGLTDRAEVWKMRPDGSDRVNLTQASGAGPKVNEAMSTFSPDGKRIVFRSSRNGKMNLYLMDSDGKNVRQLTDGSWRDNFPVFSPDGNAIAFSSDRDGPKDVRGNRTFDNYVLQLNSDGSPGALQRLSNHPGQDSHPYFSPDGKWVSFSSERAGINDEEPVVQEVVFAPQMYGEVFVQRLSDGMTIRVTHNKWEEGTSFWLPPSSQ
jgi:Tol biopolymer transport system component